MESNPCETITLKITGLSSHSNVHIRTKAMLYDTKTVTELDWTWHMDPQTLQFTCTNGIELPFTERVVLIYFEIYTTPSENGVATSVALPFISTNAQSNSHISEAKLLLATVGQVSQPHPHHSNHTHS